MRWIAGASLIAVAIGMGWAATAMIPAATVTIDQTSLKFLPPDTQGLAVVDVAGLRGAPLVQTALQLQPTLEGPQGLQQFITETGVDPLKDVDTVTVAKVGQKDAFVVIQGRIDKFKVQQALTNSGKQSEGYLGQTIFYDKNGAVALLDSVVLLGQVDAVKKALDQMQIPGSAPLRSDLMAQIQTIEAGNQVWAVGNFSIADLPAAGIRGPAPAMEMLKSLQGGTYQMRVDTGIHARATGNFSDADSAKNLRDLARGALALIKMQVAKQQPDMLNVLDGIQVSTTGNTLVVQVDESGDLLNKMRHGLNGLNGIIR